MSTRAPARIWTAMEGRSVFEYATWNLLGRLPSPLPEGDGHHVLVLPGFTASDRSTAPLRLLLRRLGYQPHRWRLGLNLGPVPHISTGLDRRFERIVEKADGAPISLVGWSLGGLFARDLARRHPEQVRQVITLGSPIQMQPGDPSAAQPLWNALERGHDPIATDRLLTIREPLPVPTTAVYSRSDGVVHWRTCIERRSDTSESVEVFGSHCGLGVNASVAIVVADRLAQPADEWRRFRPPLWALGQFPVPVHHRDRATVRT